jgi:hypothetical protein
MKSDPIRDKTIRWTFEDGPMKGKTFEHTFGADGTVSWRCSDDSMKGASKYESLPVSDVVHAVSYLSADSGFTLTTILDFATGRMVSFASNAEQLFPQRGHFEAVRQAA